MKRRKNRLIKLTQPVYFVWPTDNCHAFLNGDLTFPCWTLNGKCYCFSTEQV